jgi:hypothetical protein
LKDPIAPLMKRKLTPLVSRTGVVSLLYLKNKNLLQTLLLKFNAKNIGNIRNSRQGAHFIMIVEMQK